MNSNLTEKKQIRRFGLIAFIFFGILCLLGIWKGKLLPVSLFGSLSALGLGFILAPLQLKPIYSAWQHIAFLLGKAFTTIILIFLYYSVITPAGLIKRLIGGTPLPTRPNDKISSYWVARLEPAQPKGRFLKRY
jgi:hypothetical protein